MFGRNTTGQLGLGHTMQKNTPAELNFPPKNSESNFSTFLDVACGDEHTGMITEDGRVLLVGRGVTSMFKYNIYKNNFLKLSEK